MSLLNQTAVREYALICSQEMRAGKFERVGQDFIDAVEADLEAVIRKLAGEAPDRMPTTLNDGTYLFVQSEVLPKVVEKLNEAIRQIIARKTMRQPSCGKTLRGDV